MSAEPAPLPAPPAAEREQTLAELVAARFGISLASLAPAVVRSLLASLPDPLDAADPESFQRILSACSIGETMFMRHEEQFRALRELAPRLLERKGGAPLRVWSAGCASGEEAYSLAATLRECVGGAATVIATDLNPAAIARARGGRYRPWSLRGVQLDEVAGWLRCDGLDVVVSDDVRRLVEFGVLNLACDPYPAGLDVVFCRNVLLYFCADAAKRFFARLARSLSPGGLLFLGTTDPGPDEDGDWERVDGTGTHWYRRRAAEPVRASAAPPPPAQRALASVPAPASAGPSLPASGLGELLAMARGLAAQRAFGEALRVLQKASLEAALEVAPYTLTALVADEMGDVELALAAARRSCFLAPEEPVPLFLLASCLARVGETARARGQLERARAALAGARRRDEPLPYGEGLTAAQLGRMIDVQLARLA